MDMNDPNVTPGKVAGQLASMFTDSGGLWVNSRFIVAEVPLNWSEVSRVLPLGVWPATPAKGILFIVDYTKPSFTVPYHECALLVNVTTIFGAGLHCCWMLVDDDTAMIYGRELLGYPKKMGKFVFEEKENHASASVKRRGKKVLSMECEIGDTQYPPEPLFARKTFNVGGLGQFMAINPVWMFRPREIIRESRAAEVKLKIEHSDFDPIDKLVAGDPIRGRFVVSDIPGTRYMFPVGLTGLIYHARTFFMRYR